MIPKILDPNLDQYGLVEKTFPLPASLIQLRDEEKWREIDQFFLEQEKPGGLLFTFLSAFLEFNSIEHIIAIRSAPDDEDGIWHDDGSRILGFSLSLNQNHQAISGGELRFRPKGQGQFESISARPMGEILVFKTGIYGYEHMVSAVTKGRRIVIAGWCS